VPEFEDLTEEMADEIRASILHGSIGAIKRLREVTGCSLGWANLWVSHGGRPQDEFFGTGPCPYCGRPLRSPAARQCGFVAATGMTRGTSVSSARHSRAGQLYRLGAATCCTQNALLFRGSKPPNQP
jgi:hypothetical protein